MKHHAIMFVLLIAGAASALAVGLRYDDTAMGQTGADHPHHWFAWRPVRLQGGKPIPSVQLGGRMVWLKTIERYRFFDHWVYREIGDTREMPR